MQDTGHWVYEGDLPDLEDQFGFIYEITHVPTGKFYIGKKQMWTKRKLPPLKGKTRKRSKIVETDWRSYTSSSTQLNEDIDKLGKDQFEFRILRFYSSKSELAYYEAKLQFERDVLLTEKSYNGIINLRIGRIKQSEPN